MRSIPDLSRPGSKILVQRADRLGDTVLALPVVEQLRKWFPEAKIDFLCGPISKGLLKNHPLIDQLHVCKVNKWGRIEGKKELLKTLKSQEYDVYISLWDKPFFAKLGKQAKIPIRIGSNENLLNRRFYTHRVNEKNRDFTQHQIELNLNILKPLNIPLDETPTSRLYPSTHWDVVVSAFFKKHIDPNKKTVLIFCNTGGSNLNVPPEVLVEFIKRLTDYTVILCYGSQEDNDSPLKDLDYPHVVNMTRLVPFEELVTLIQKVDFYVGPDTGPTHLASFLNKPLLVFFLKRSLFPTRWGPVSDCFQILRTDDRCSPKCGRVCVPECPSGSVDLETTLATFNELVTDVMTQTKLSDSEKKEVHLKNSVRVLAVFSGFEERDRARNGIQKLLAKGVRVYPFIWTGWNDLGRLLRAIRQSNINVIQGKLALGLASIITFYMGPIKQYIIPVYIDEFLHDHVDYKDYLEMYQNAWSDRG